MHFADLHDTPVRMKEKGVIRDVVPWERSREFFFWRLRRRLLESRAAAKVKRAAAAGGAGSTVRNPLVCTSLYLCLSVMKTLNIGNEFMFLCE